VEELHGELIVGPRPKFWTKDQKWKRYCQRWRAGEAQMRDNPEGGELNSAGISAGAARRIIPFHPA